MRRNKTSLTLILGGIMLAGFLAFSAASFGAEPEAAATHPQLNSAVHPEESAAEKELNGGVGTLVATIAVFLGLLVVLRAAAWKPIMAGLKGREEAIRNSIEGAKKAREDTERTTRELEAKMAEVQSQAALQLSQAKNDAVKIATSIRAAAEAESAALKDRTLREIDAAKQQALGEINNHAATLGTAVAAKILKRQVTVDDQQRLVEESLAELGKKELGITMADNDFQIESIGEVYAQALINEAQKQNALEQVTEDVRGIGGLLKTNVAFAAFAHSLTIGEDERLAAIAKIFGQDRVHPLTLQTLESIARRDRFMFLNGFVMGFEEIIKKMSGHTDVELVTSGELPQQTLDHIQQAVAANIGHIADLKVSVNPALIGGMMLRIGDTLIDGSVATQLAKIQDQLKRTGVSSLQGNVAAAMA